MSTIISVVSGKGGSGKSLMTAVLGRAIAREGARVLLVDMDIFVRGLTVLLYGFTHPEPKEGTTTVSDLLGVFSEYSAERSPLPTERTRYLIQRFFECDVLPAVDNISAPLDYDDKNISDERFCNDRVQMLLDSVRDEYDYIFLDNRAGMDSLIAATCKNAQIVLAVAEDDEVGRQTNINLIRFLQSKRYARVVYTILNKGRRIRDYSQAKERARQRYEFAMLGVIPFDLDVLEEFGSERFWTTIMETLYFRALLDAWNELARIARVKELSESKYHFPPRIFMTRSQGRYTLIERMLRVYSIMFIAFGAAFWAYSEFISGEINMLKFSAVVSILVGGVALVLSTSNLQSFFRGQVRSDDER